MTETEAGERGAAPETGPVRLAVFDFDGTSIAGNSPVLLVAYLIRHKMLAWREVLKIMAWALAYKLRLPHNESWVRGLIFTAFAGRPHGEVDGLFSRFYDEEVAGLFRPVADAAMRAHTEAGEVVLVVSATFEPIIIRAMEQHPFHHQVSTRMHVDGEGRYTRDVEGLPVEGAEKVAAITAYADAVYSKGGWELAYAYGDHHSDQDLLRAATHAFAVLPDRALLRIARREGWPVLDWR